MTDTGLIVPWWLLSLLAGVLMTVLVWQRQRLRRWSHDHLGRLVGVLSRGRDRCHAWAVLWGRRADTAYASFSAYLANFRYRLSIVDFTDLLSRRWARVEALCENADALIQRVHEDLESTRAEEPEAPEWVAAADSIGSLPGGGQPATAKILEAMLEAAEKHHAEAMREFRWSSAVRGRALLASARYWRNLKRRLGRIADYGRELRQTEQNLAGAAERCRELRERGPGRRILSSVFNGLISTLALVAGIWLALFLLRITDTMVPAAPGPAWLDVWPAAYLVLLLLVGTVTASALRWSDVVAPAAELPRRWRLALATIAGAALLALAIGTMQPAVTSATGTLVNSGWSFFSVWSVGVVLYSVPLFVAVQLCVLAHWFRAVRPLSYFLVERSLLGAELILGLTARGAQFLQGGISLEAAAPEPPASEPGEHIALVADISSKKR